MDITNSRNRIFYALKPLIPRRAQLWLRRRMILRKRRAVADRWPILEAAGRPPSGWPGWPEGKRFALVLTHDVEWERGQDRCLDLMRLEQARGFRSCFNFVPERYCVSSEIRATLVAAGFEVGVHGLLHDGKLFQSRAIFLERAPRINAYLAQWRAVGFCSPASHHNLDWMHDLNIEYDSSTFDTDPFEPQPDGLQTIFPLWVAKEGSNAGYVELPYTLPQDFTLFVLMREPNGDIWQRKLDWIAKHGGMAHLIAHPDYMRFSGGPAGEEEYPVEHYTALLDYIATTYAGQFWNPLPCRLADYYRSQMRLSAPQTQTA